jgi:hypothetical protein
MKICIAQTKPIKGNVSANIEAHKRFIELALTLNAEAIFFQILCAQPFDSAQEPAHFNFHFMKELKFF